MNFKRLFLLTFWIVIFSVHQIYTQQLSTEQTSCGFQPTPADAQAYQKRMEKVKAWKAQNGTDLPNLKMENGIPIAFHIVTNNGAAIASIDDVFTAVDNLNTVFNGLFLSFTKCGSINYIDSPTFYNLNGSEPWQLFNNGVNGIINIYFVNSLNVPGFGSAAGAYYPGTENIVVINSAATATTLIHEMGHLFGLWHTHETAFGVESIDGSNCDTAGDRICDTPADPDLTGNVNDLCHYSGTATQGGVVYFPQVNNYMSYSLPDCRDLFTLDQMVTMFLNYINEKDFAACPAPCPDLIVNNVFLSANNVNAGSSIGTLAEVKNIGSATATYSRLRYYFSTNSWFSSDDIYLGQTYLSPLAENESEYGYIDYTVPNTLVSGTYYIIYLADATNSVAECDEQNNGLAKSFSVTNNSLPDYKMVSPTAPQSANAGEYIWVANYIENQGQDANSTSYQGFFLSSDTFFGASDTFVDYYTTPALDAGDWHLVQKQIQIPTNISPGNYYLAFYADRWELVVESNEVNNLIFVPITITGGVNYANIPYSTSFNGNSLDQYWSTESTCENGRIQVTSSHGPYSGSKHLTMDVFPSGTWCNNYADLYVNLAGQTILDLNFAWKDFGDETHAFDAIYFSNNGGNTFKKVFSFNNGTNPNNTWKTESLWLEALAQQNGLSLTSNFVIRFSQYDNYSIPSDGMAFDNVQVLAPAGFQENGRGSETTSNLTLSNDTQTNVFEIATELSLNSFPNPVTDILNVEIHSGKNLPATLSLNDVNGKQIQSLFTGDLTEGIQDFQFEIENIPTGIYLLKLQTQEGVLVRKIVMQQ